MSLRQSQPSLFVPTGLSDSLDATLTPNGGNMHMLSNLVPDPSTQGVWACRPAAVELYNFTDFPDPAAISCLFGFGRYIFGMVASSTTPGYDEPFCYDVVADAIVAISGVTGLNVPASLPSSGDWSPPHMELIGVNLVVTHAGFDGVTNFFGWIDISNMAAPAWHAGNVTISGTGVVLPSKPVWCAQFFGRAYFLVNPPTAQPAAFFTDPLTLNNSDATHILTFDDNVPLTNAIGMAYNTQLSGGIVQFLLVFKGQSQIYQVQGDAALTDNPLRQNALNVPTGTLAPNSVVRTSKGVMFMAPDGYRLIDFQAQVSDPIGAFGAGVSVPFIYAAVPSRVAAAYNSGVLRVSVQNNNALGSPVQEYWLHTATGAWSGPHTFPASLIVPYQNSFIMVANGIAAKLWQSDVLLSAGVTFVENGVQMTWSYQTCMLADSGAMMEERWIETTMDLALVSGMPPVVFSAIDQDDFVIQTASYTISGGTTLWGAFIWGAASWGGVPNGLRPRQIKWKEPVVYRRVALAATGESRSGVRIGKMLARREATGYLQMTE